MYHILDQLISTGSPTEAATVRRKASLTYASPRGRMRKATGTLASRPQYRRMMWLFVYLAGFLVPAIAWGQDRNVLPTTGYYLRPEATVGEMYDDNVFRSISGRKDDFISRIGAGVGGGYESVPLTLIGHYRMTSEIYTKNPDLSNAFSEQEAGINFTYLPTRLWTLGLIGEYIDTDRPETINAPTGVLGNRERGRSYSFSPSVVHLYDAITTLSAVYTYNHTEESKGGGTIESHTALFVADRRLTERDTLHLGFTFRDYITSSDGGGDESETSYIPSVGWSRVLSPLTSFTVNVGPRFSSTGKVTPEALLTAVRMLQNGDLSFTYKRTQYAIVGDTAPVTTDMVKLTWSHQLLKQLFFTVSPVFYNDSGGQHSSKVYELDLAATYQINKWLGFRASYQFTYEEGRQFFDTPSSTTPIITGDVYRNLVLLELVAFYPMRVY